MEYIYFFFNSYGVRELVLPLNISLIRLALTRKLQNQGLVVVHLKSLLRKFHSRYYVWLTVTLCLCHMGPWICSICRQLGIVCFLFYHIPDLLSLFVAYHRILNMSNITGVTNETETA
jgi:hypothetical protein